MFVEFDWPTSEGLGKILVNVAAIQVVQPSDSCCHITLLDGTSYIVQHRYEEVKRSLGI